MIYFSQDKEREVNNMRKSYIREMEQLLSKGEWILDSITEEDEWDDFLDEVSNMNEHLKIALKILKEVE